LNITTVVLCLAVAASHTHAQNAGNTQEPPDTSGAQAAIQAMQQAAQPPEDNTDAAGATASQSSACNPNWSTIWDQMDPDVRAGVQKDVSAGTIDRGIQSEAGGSIEEAIRQNEATEQDDAQQLAQHQQAGDTQGAASIHQLMLFNEGLSEVLHCRQGTNGIAQSPQPTANKPNPDDAAVDIADAAEKYMREAAEEWGTVEGVHEFAEPLILTLDSLKMADVANSGQIPTTIPAIERLAGYADNERTMLSALAQSPW